MSSDSLFSSAATTECHDPSNRVSAASHGDAPDGPCWMVKDQLVGQQPWGGMRAGPLL